MSNETKKTYETPDLEVYGDVNTLTQAGGRPGGPGVTGNNPNGNGNSFGFLSHMPPGNPTNNAPGQGAKSGGPRPK